LNRAVIVEAARSPVGRRDGALSSVHPVDLHAAVLGELMLRAGVDPIEVDDHIAGCVSQVGEQSLNEARNAWLAAGFPESVPSTTIDRQCGSSQQAIAFASQGIEAGAYDVVVLAGVLEHLEQPMEQLAALAALVAPGGLLCVQSPSFANFRGDVYNTLGALLGLPMSLTDLWQVTPGIMASAAPALGVRLERVVGGHYRLGFLDRALEDFRQRVPAAARDAGQGAGWHWDRFFAWIEERVAQNRVLVDAWVAQGWLKPVPVSPPLAVRRPAGLDDDVWRPLEQYLTHDGWREPWYADAPPLCYHGASAVYLYRKGGT